MPLKLLLREVRACRICEADLPFGPRPVLQLASTARLLIIGQAPGSKVHQTGIPWNDASGDRLRDWLSTIQRELPSCPWDFVIPVPEKAEAINRLAPNVHRFGTRVCSSTFRISG